MTAERNCPVVKGVFSTTC